MNEHADSIKEQLKSIIIEMAKSPELFLKDPKRDFTRERKLPFETMIHLLLSMGGNSICKELLAAYIYETNAPTSSAFIQQRNKILPFTFEFLFCKFTETLKDTKKYKGYRLFAVDGSSLRMPTDGNIQVNPNKRAYNVIWLNTIYDLCNRLYINVKLQAPGYRNELKALTEMVDNSGITGKVIIVADRGYEGYNSFSHIEKKGWNYLIRVKDLGSTGILSGLSLPSDGEFDISFHRIFTKKRDKEFLNAPERYKVVNGSKFELLDLQYNGFYPMTFRIVRFRVAKNSYETVITNLSKSDFQMAELKELYSKRWGIETSFRELKYAVGLNNIHAKKREYIVQEIFAKMILYNFSEMITSHVVIQTETQHPYQVNFTIAIYICRYFLRCRNNVIPPDVEALICKNILPIRPNRTAPRNDRFKRAVSFNYRIA